MMVGSGIMFKEKLNEKNILVSIFCSFLLFLLSIFILCCPILRIKDFSFVYPLFFGVYALTELLLFALSYHRKEYSNFISFLISFVLFIMGFLMNLTESPRSIAISLLVFVLVNALAKLKRADYYHDRKSRLWSIEMTILVMFIVTGVVTSLNFAWGVEAQILTLGFFALICSIFKVVELLVVYLTKGKLK